MIERTAAERGCPLVEVGRDVQFTYSPVKANGDRPRVTIRTPRREWPALELGLLGAHQAANAAVVVACVEQLQKLGLSIRDRDVAEGLAQVEWPARLEI